MMRQASIRNQRNKGLRLNHFLQICILTLVFFWLLYQLKHSFDKKKGPDEHRSRSLNNAIDSHSEFVVLGRKALPHVQNIASKGKVSNEDKENEDEEEEEEEEVEKGEEGESRHTMDDEEVKEIPEDGIDELENEQEDEQDDQERGDEEAEDGDDAVNEEEKDEQVEEAEFLDDQDPEEDSSPEAHEKGYKNDDEFSSLHQYQSNGIGDWNNRVDEEQLEKREKGVEVEGKTGRRNAGNNSTIADVIAKENYINYNNSLTTSGSSIEKMVQEVSPIDHSKLEGNLLTAGVLDIQGNRQTNETIGKNNLLPLDNEALIESIGNAQKMNPL